jgi:hypothetical protein
VRDTPLETRPRDWLAAVPVALLALWVFAPFFADLRAMGFQDWDSQAGNRFVTVLALRHGQLPWWNPWSCGGFPAWGFAESATNLVSPFAPLYFLFSFPVALRLEAVAATLVAVAGAFLLAGRFTRSPAGRALVATIWVLNSRWALQTAVGHMWHLAYAWSPFVFYFFDRALAERRWAPGGAAGALLALIIYVGGIYPYPHTVLLLGLFALAVASGTRSLRPLGMLVLTLGTSVGLPPPARHAGPDSGHLRGAGRAQAAPGARHDEPLSAPGGVGRRRVAGRRLDDADRSSAGLRPLSPPAAARVLGLVGVGGLRRRGGVWMQMHRLPVFRSQHLPARILFLGILLLALVLVAALDAPWARFSAGRRWVEPAALALVVAYGVDLALVARQATRPPFHLRMPPVPAAGPFRPESAQRYQYGKPDVAPNLRDRYGWPAKIIYPSMLANTGLVNCYGLPSDFRSPVVGSDQPGYRGLVFTEGPGRATLLGWKPNGVRVRVEGAGPGTRLVYDTTFDPGWRVGGAPAGDWRGLVAGRVPPGDSVVEVRYRPVGLGEGLLLFALTAGSWAAGLAWRRTRRRLTAS